MAEGRSNQGIAEKLVITVRGVEKYVSSIFGKLRLPSSGNDSAESWPCCCTCVPDARREPLDQKTAPYVDMFPPSARGSPLRGSVTRTGRRRTR